MDAGRHRPAPGHDRHCPVPLDRRATATRRDRQHRGRRGSSRRGLDRPVVPRRAWGSFAPRGAVHRRRRPLGGRIQYGACRARVARRAGAAAPAGHRSVRQRARAPARRAGHARERRPVPTARRKRAADDLDVVTGRSAYVFQRAVAARHRLPVRGRPRRRLALLRTPRRPRRNHQDHPLGRRRPRAIHARVPAATRRRRAPLGDRPRCAATLRGWHAGRLYRLGRRRDGASHRPEGAAREQRPPQRHLRFRLRARRGDRPRGRDHRGQRRVAAARRGQRRQSRQRLGRRQLLRHLPARDRDDGR